MAAFEELLERALAARRDLIDLARPAGTGLGVSAFRVFNGFIEGCPGLAIDRYADTAVIFNYADPPEQLEPLVARAAAWVRRALPDTGAVLIKTRHAANPAERQGRIVYGAQLAREVNEHGVRYALDLRLNQDAGLYLDTRNLRRWALDSLGGKTVLNTFAYTGSLGVAARAGGAAGVVHLDLSRAFLNVAKQSYTLNGWPIERGDFQAGDFWDRVGRYKQAGQRFDCVFLDPPLFAETRGGRVDLVGQSHRVINKVRPLINHDGWLVTINNALFVSGAEYVSTLEALCASGYLAIEELIPVPDDFAGYPSTRAGAFPADPAPFNHPTKIAVLRVKRKE